MSAIGCRAAIEQTSHIKCPICSDKFDHVTEVESVSSGYRLDLKLQGSWIVPTALPECSKCGFTVPLCGDDDDGEFSRSQTKTLRALAASPLYREANIETSYYRAGLAMENLGCPPDEIAMTFLAASWQVDHDKVRCQGYLARCSSWLDVYFRKPEGEQAKRIRLTLLRGEVFRRLERWVEAGQLFDRISRDPLFASLASKAYIEQQIDLLDQYDSEPHLSVREDTQVEIVGMQLVSLRTGEQSANRKAGRLPVFPPGPYAARLSGVATVSLTVSPSGSVVGTRTRQATSVDFGRAVARAANTWVFQPVEIDGLPSTVEMECTVRFIVANY